MNLTVILIMVAVLIVLPVIFARISGKNPMEMFFGSRVNKTSFAGEKPENEKQREPKKGREKNSTKNDIMVLISRLLTYARRNRFYTIVPGTLTIGEQTASLAAVVVTRGCVLGVNCYGFGGSIEGKSGSADWVQTLNGERKSFPSPTVKNEEQRKILADVLVQGHQQLLGILGSHDDAALNTCLGCVGGHQNHVKEKVVWSVRNHSKVSITSLHLIGGNFDLDLVLFVFVSHNCSKKLLISFYLVKS